MILVPFDFYDAIGRQYRVSNLGTDDAPKFWLLKQHPDGQFVTQCPLSAEDVSDFWERCQKVKPPVTDGDVDLGDWAEGQ